MKKKKVAPQQEQALDSLRAEFAKITSFIREQPDSDQKKRLITEALDIDLKMKHFAKQMEAIEKNT